MRRIKEQHKLPALLAPLQHFTNLQALSGVVLVCSSILALILANSVYAPAFENFWHTKIGFTIGSLQVYYSLHQWINDGLMAIFFFVIGLEIKREIFLGELSSGQQAILPVVAAIGGAAVPALIYAAFNYGGPGSSGWGIPMATDIAFVLGIITLLGKRVPSALKVFVLAFAIIDDIIAISAIALFYTAEVNIGSLAIGLALFLAALAAAWGGLYNTIVFLVIAILVWFAFLRSGVHPTIAGVIMAMTIPVYRKTKRSEYVGKVSESLEAISGIEGRTKPEKEKQQGIINEIEHLSADTKSKLYKLEHVLNPYTSFGIMPLFALANAGISFDAVVFESVSNPVSVGIMVALLIGKPVGIFLSVWLSVKSRIAVMPTGANMRHVLGVAFLGGMGFTLSLFISVLAFRDPQLLVLAKIGILIGSLLSVIAGISVLLTESHPGNR